MILADEAEFMYPVPASFKAIEGLGCNGCFDTCGGMHGLGDITDRGDFGMFLCNNTPLAWTEACRVPSQAEIITSKSDYGGHLSPSSQAAAEDMAAKAVVSDCLAHPELYNLVPGSCSYTDPTLGYVIAGLGVLLFISIIR